MADLLSLSSSGLPQSLTFIQWPTSISHFHPVACLNLSLSSSGLPQSLTFIQWPTSISHFHPVAYLSLSLSSSGWPTSLTFIQWLTYISHFHPMADLHLSLSSNGLPKSLTPRLGIQVSFQVWHFLLLPGKNKIKHTFKTWKQNDKVCKVQYLLILRTSLEHMNKYQKHTHTHTHMNKYQKHTHTQQPTHPPKSTPFWHQKSYLVVVVGAENFSSSKPPSNINLHKKEEKKTLQSALELHKIIHTFTPTPNSLFTQHFL